MKSLRGGSSRRGMRRVGWDWQHRFDRLAGDPYFIDNLSFAVEAYWVGTGGW